MAPKKSTLHQRLDAIETEMATANLLQERAAGHSYRPGGIPKWQTWMTSALLAAITALSSFAAVSSRQASDTANSVAARLGALETEIAVAEVKQENIEMSLDDILTAIEANTGARLRPRR